VALRVGVVPAAGEVAPTGWRRTSDRVRAAPGAADAGGSELGVGSA
jgi:hypothetical protein